MSTWDVLVVGAGPAGAATALGVLHTAPRLRVAMLDRAEFPRDKACGDGVAPQVLDLLAEVGVPRLLEDRTPVAELRLSQDGVSVGRRMARPAWVVPRTLLDDRLVAAARAAGATVLRHRVRRVSRSSLGVSVDDEHLTQVLVGADGAHSVVRRGLGLPPGRRALAMRGYAPTRPADRGAQRIVFGTSRQPSYAWSFDRGDGWSNIGYGELLTTRHPPPSRALLRSRLAELLPGADAEARDWATHHLPLSSPRWRPTPGPVLLVGDAAGLVNPLTGEGIYYAVLTGLAAGRAAAEALAAGDPARAGAAHARLTRPLLAAHLRHTALAARLAQHDRVLGAGLRAAAADQRVFDDLVELGLARGRLSPRLMRGLAEALTHRHGPGTKETTP